MFKKKKKKNPSGYGKGTVPYLFPKSFFINFVVQLLFFFFLYYCMLKTQNFKAKGLKVQIKIQQFVDIH